MWACKVSIEEREDERVGARVDVGVVEGVDHVVTTAAMEA